MGEVEQFKALPAKKRKVLIPEIADKVAVAAILNPFEPETTRVELPEGGTIAEILKGLGMPASMPARIFVDDRMVLERERDFIKPKRGQYVTIRVQPQGAGQGGGNKSMGQIMALVGAIAVGVVVGVVTGGIGLGLVAFSVAGTLGTLANQLVNRPSQAQRSFNTSPATFTVSSKQNIAAPLAPIPVIFGTRLVSPMLAATPYTHYIGSDQYLRMIFVIGQGPLDISSVKIQDTLLESYGDVEAEFRAGYPDDAPITLYPGSNFQSAFSLNLSTSVAGNPPTLSGWQQQTSGTNADQLAVVVSAPLFNQAGASNGASVPLTCRLQIRWAPTGTTSWTNEPSKVITSTASGQVTKAHTWSVPRGQYDVQVQVNQFVPYKGDWTNPYQADFSWTELDTIRGQAPYAISGLALIALNIRATRQLNGVINNLYARVSSILKDYNPVSTLWDDRAGSWFYDYDNAGAGASLYALDAANALDTAAVTGTNFIANEQIGIADGSKSTFAFTLSATPVQPGSLIISVGNNNDATSAGLRRHTAAPSALSFVTDDGQGNISCDVQVAVGGVAQSVITAKGSINYSTGVGTVSFYNDNYISGPPPIPGSPLAPALGNNPVCDYVQVVKTAGAGRALAITTASGSDGAGVASKSMWSVLTQPDPFNGLAIPVHFTISGWYKASSAISAGIRLRAFFGSTEDFATTDAGVTHQDIIANGAATTAYQQVTATITAPQTATGTPSGLAKWLRIVAYHNPDGVGGVTVYWDRLSCSPSGAQISSNVNQLPNPSFDFPGVITSNPASHFRNVCESNALKLPASRLDLTTLQTWWQDNVDAGRFYNGILDSPGTVYGVLRDIAAIGRASYAVKNGLHSVVFDKPQTTPIQHISPRNSWGFKSTKAFPNLPQGLKVRYTNPANNYQPDEILVYDDNPAGGLYAPNTVQLWESLDLTKTCTDATMAWKLGRYHLAQARLRPEVYEISMDFENLVATRGDLVVVSHDVPEWGQAWGRVKTVNLDGSGNCLGVVVDDSSLTFQDGFGYVTRFRLSSTGNTLLCDGVGGNPGPLVNPAAGTGASVSTNQLQFVAPIGFGNPMPSVGDLVMFGLLGSESAPLLITKITPGKKLSAILTLVDYAPAVYTADANPPGVVSIGPAPGAIAPTVISANSSDQYSIRDADGSIQPRIMIQLAPATSIQTKWGHPSAIEYQVRVTAGSELNDRGAYNAGTTYAVSDMVEFSGLSWMSQVAGNVGVTPGTDATKWVVVDESSEWSTPARIAVQSQILVPLVQVGVIYDVELRYIYPGGAFSAWTVLAGHFVAGQVTGPNDVTSLTATPIPNTGGVLVSFTGSTSPNVKAYSIRLDGDDLAHEVARGLHTRYELNSITPGAHTVYIATYDSSGNSSPGTAGAHPSASVTAAGTANFAYTNTDAGPYTVGNGGTAYGTWLPICTIASVIILSATNHVEFDATGTQAVSGAQTAGDEVDTDIAYSTDGGVTWTEIEFHKLNATQASLNISLNARAPLLHNIKPLGVSGTLMFGVRAKAVNGSGHGTLAATFSAITLRVQERR